jgi:hypothetical protein
VGLAGEEEDAVARAEVDDRRPIRQSFDGAVIVSM